MRLLLSLCLVNFNINRKSVEIYQICFEPNEKVLAIGDNLRTDIKGANNLNKDCLFITNGVHRNEFNSNLELQKLLNKYKVKANYFQKELQW